MTVARRNFSTEVRSAIWEVWKRKCAFTGEPVSWTQMNVDHVIPLARLDILEKLIDNEVVSADFDINGFENLLPVHSHHNRGKSAREINLSALIWFLEQAQSKKPEIEKKLSAMMKSNVAIKAYLSLKADSEKNDVSPEEMVRFYAHRFEGTVPLRISPEIEGTQITSANSAVAASLMDMPFALGCGTISAVTLRSDSGAFVTCTTSNEFIRARESGCYAYTTAEIKIASMANETCLNPDPGSRAIRELLPGTPNMPGSSGGPGRYGGGRIRAGQ